MITADRIILAGDKSFQNCAIYDVDEQKSMGVLDLFEIDQFYFIDNLGKGYLVPDYIITTIEFMHNNIPDLALSTGVAKKVKRINVSSDITHAPAWIILNKDYDKLGVPRVFDGIMQFTLFGTDKILRITSDPNISLIEYA